MRLVLNEKNTFCISLDSRWPAMQERLKRLGIPCTRFHAHLPSGLQENFADHMTPAQCACAQSHICLYREALQSGLDYVMVLEDDVLFHRDWRTMLDEREYDRGFDLLLLNASEKVEPEDTWVATNHQWLTGGYIISCKGILWILARFYYQKWEADCMTWHLQDLGHSYTRFPWLIVQEGKDSTVGSDFEANRSKVLELLGKERLALYS